MDAKKIALHEVSDHSKSNRSKSFSDLRGEKNLSIKTPKTPTNI